MARVSYVEPEQATGDVKQVYEQTFKNKPGNIQMALAHRPEILKNFLAFYGSVGKALDKRLYEMIYIRVSIINGCQY